MIFIDILGKGLKAQNPVNQIIYRVLIHFDIAKSRDGRTRTFYYKYLIINQLKITPQTRCVVWYAPHNEHFQIYIKSFKSTY